ncbi:Uncharacterised protein [Coprococcus eutactus]|nr:Uncharacterised protein [Coprococcus eutactus]
MKLLMKIKQNKTVRTIIQKKCITISTVILSRKGLEARVYNSGSEPVAWETITIRRYLNNEFLSSCFDAREQGKICDSEIRNKGKNNTIDKLFLLSLEEAESMFNSDEERKCAVSEQAKRKGAYSDESTGNVWWWLRTPGEKKNYEIYVTTNGSIVREGCYAGSLRGVLRPAMWVDGNVL